MSITVPSKGEGAPEERREPQIFAPKAEGAMATQTLQRRNIVPGQLPLESSIYWRMEDS